MKKVFAMAIFLLSFVIATQAQTKTPSEAQVRTELENGMVSFINSVKPVYKAGMSASEFKLALVGAKNAESITQEGRELLNQAHSLLSKSANEDVIKRDGTKSFAKATIYVLKYTKAQNLSADSEEASIALFGGDKDGLNDTMTTGKKSCKWYQIVCHLGNFFDWLNDHSGGIGVAIDIIVTVCKLFFGC